MILCELFDTFEPIRWTRRDDARWEGQFVVGKLKFIIVFDRPDDRKDAEWEVNFSMMVEDRIYTVATRTQLAGSDAKTILATVRKAMVDFAITKRPTTLIFYAEKERVNRRVGNEDARSNVYAMMIQKSAQDLRRLGYTAEHIPDHHEDKFVIRRVADNR